MLDHPSPKAKAVRPEQIRLFVFPEQVELGVHDGTCRVARRREALLAEGVEAHREVLEEVALVGVIAITEYYFIAEVLAIVHQFFLDIRELGVKLILFGVFRLCQIFSCHKWYYFAGSGMECFQTPLALRQWMSCLASA